MWEEMLVVNTSEEKAAWERWEAKLMWEISEVKGEAVWEAKLVCELWGANGAVCEVRLVWELWEAKVGAVWEARLVWETPHQFLLQ